MRDRWQDLQERMQSYNHKWTYSPHHDMASLLYEIMGEQLCLHQTSLDQLPTQKQNQVYAMLPFGERSDLHSYQQVVLTCDVPTWLEKHSIVSAQDGSGKEASYEVECALFLHSTHISKVLAMRGSKQSIALLSEQGKLGFSWTNNTHELQKNALYFNLVDMFEYGKVMTFHVFFSSDDAFVEDLLDPSKIKIYLESEQGIIDVEARKKKQGIQITLAKQATQARITALVFEVQDVTSLAQHYLQNVCFSWQGDNLRSDFILGEDQIFNKDEFALFGEPMAISNACYIRANEALHNPQACIILRFYVETKCWDQGMELLQKQEYRAWMRKLPVELPIYDAYADEVVLEYFNGAAWCALFNTQSVQTIFKSNEKQRVEVEFKRPSDVTSCSIKGKEGYYIRFRLVKSAHLYQFPCHVHVPYISHLRIQYTMEQPQYAKQVLLYSQRSVMDISEQLTKEGCTIFKKFAIHGDAMFFALHDIVYDVPCGFYFDLIKEQANPSSLCIYYAQRDLRFYPLEFVDHSDGLSHSGTIEMMFPTSFLPTTLFGEEAFWLQLSFQDHEAKEVQVRQIINNMATLRHRFGSQDPTIFLSLKKHENVSVKALDAPFAILPKARAKQDILRLALLVKNAQFPVSEEDLKQSMGYEFLDLLDLLFLAYKHRDDTISSHYHVIVLFRDIQHHRALLQVRKEELLRFLQPYEIFIKAHFIIEEPIFIKVFVRVILPFQEVMKYEDQQRLLHVITKIFAPVDSVDEGNKDSSWIGKRRTVQAVKRQCQGFPQLKKAVWYAHVEYQLQGKLHHCALDDVPIYPAMVLINGRHRIEAGERSEEA